MSRILEPIAVQTDTWIDEEILKAKKSQRYLLAVFWVEEEDLHLSHSRVNFPLADHVKCLEMLKEELAKKPATTD